MVTSRPTIDKLGYYGVTAAADVLGISRRTLRRYEAQGYIVSHLNKRGVRRYRGLDLINLWNAYA